MRKMFLLFSHQLSDEQKNDAKTKWLAKEFIYLSEDLQKQWSNISPEIEQIDISKVENFIKNSAEKDDLVLIQGDFGAVYKMINFCKSLGLITLYATTKRVVREKIINGQTIKTSVFEHIRFREYK